MNKNRKLEVISLNLGIQIVDNKIHPETENNIQKRIEIIKKEKKAVTNLIEKNLNIDAQKCFKLLLEKQPEKIKATTLLKETQTSLSSLIQAIKRYIKTDYKEIIELKKSKIKGETYYYLKPITPYSSSTTS